MDCGKTGRVLLRHGCRNVRAPIASLRDVMPIVETLHQHTPRSRNALGIPSTLSRFLRECETRQRWNDDIEGVGRRTTVRGGVRQWADDMPEKKDCARPAMREDDRQCLRMPRSDVNKVHGESIQLGRELRPLRELDLALAPVVSASPIVDEIPQGKERWTLFPADAGFALGPAHLIEAA